MMTYSTAAWGLTGFLFFAALGQGQTRTGLELRLEQDPQTKAIRVYRKAAKDPVLTQNANADNRPYLHPIVAPDGKGLLTEYGPAHHPHQTGIFWGFKYVNGRDFFMKWQAENYRRVAADIVHAKGRTVRWRTVYDLLDENGKTIMTETQNWTMADSGDRYVLDLEWRGEPKIDVTLGKIYVGGLFVRMPWHPGTRAEAVNSAGQRNGEAEQQRAIWADLGDQVEGRDDMAHIAIFDHPENHGFPIPWRVDSQMGFGPNNESSDWLIAQGKTEIIRYRLIAYTGDLRPAAMTRAWKEFVKEY
jgi:hypothetical protein